ncbi:hypothetical protein D3C87_1840630 [compost metagenome]
MRRGFDRRAGVKPDMAGGDIGIERGLGHGTGNRVPDIGGLDAGALDGSARCLDAQVDGRDFGQGTAIVDKRRARAAQQPGVTKG